MSVAAHRETAIETTRHDDASSPAPAALCKRLVRDYDAKAHRYDTTRSVPSAGFYFDVSYRTIDAMLGPTDENTVHLDMPLGTGRFFFYLRDHGRRHRMIGIDISRGMLDVCRERSVQRGDNIELSIGDAFGLPVADGSIDILTALRLFHVFPPKHWPALLREMRRVVRPGGVLITEFRNVIRGVASRIVGEAFRGRRVRHPHYYVAPHRVRGLLRGWIDVGTQGIGLDGLETLARVTPSLARGLHGLETRSPLRYLSKTLLVKAHKAVDGC